MYQKQFIFFINLWFFFLIYKVVKHVVIINNKIYCFNINTDKELKRNQFH